MSTTLNPADAHVCAMPFPIMPAPQTPTLRISITAEELQAQGFEGQLCCIIA
jgi:hypothetical protein